MGTPRQHHVDALGAAMRKALARVADIKAVAELLRRPAAVAALGTSARHDAPPGITVSVQRTLQPLQVQQQRRA
jgi:hypothetical protein